MATAPAACAPIVCARVRAKRSSAANDHADACTDCAARAGFSARVSRVQLPVGGVGQDDMEGAYLCRPYVQASSPPTSAPGFGCTHAAAFGMTPASIMIARAGGGAARLSGVCSWATVRGLSPGLLSGRDHEQPHTRVQILRRAWRAGQRCAAAAGQCAAGQVASLAWRLASIPLFNIKLVFLTYAITRCRSLLTMYCLRAAHCARAHTRMVEGSS